MIGLPPVNLADLVAFETNFLTNQQLRKALVVNNAKSRSRLTEEMDIVGAKWHYADLKQMMRDTLKYGLSSTPLKIHSGHEIDTIASKEEYDTARSTLRDLAAFLDYYSIDVDIDNFNEDLEQLKLIPPSPPSKPKRALLGFLDDEPADHLDIESSKQENSTTKSDPQRTSLQRTQNQVELDTVFVDSDEDHELSDQQDSQGVTLSSRTAPLHKRQRIT